VIVLPEADLAETRRRAEELRREVGRLQVYQFGKLMRRCTISIGAAAFPLHGESGEALIKRADEAMYRAKRGGRNRVETAEELI
jgi:diguanylate cyclase (GGDEF)-like protein